MRRLAAIAFLGCLVAGPGWAACPTTTDTFKNAAGTTNTLCIGGTSGTAEVFQHQILDSASVYAFPAVAALSDALANPTEWTIGTNLLGWDATNSVWRRLQVDAATGTVKVDGSGATQPVSGTVTANAGTGTFNISAIPTGANTIGKVDVLGNAGAILDFAGQNVAQPANSLLIGCAFNTTPTTVASGNATQLQCTSAARLLVDGSQVTQPVNGTVTANQGGTWTTRIVGNTGATLDAAVGAAAAPTNGQVVLGVFNTTAPAPTTGQSAALQLSGLSNLLVEQGCAGQSVANTSVKPFSLASTTALKIIALISGKKVYICSINIVSASANNVALIEGTKTTNDCDTSTAGLAGGTTAATGWNFAANGGLTLGNGQGLVAKSGTASLDVCLLASASGQVSGTVVYAQY